MKIRPRTLADEKKYNFLVSEGYGGSSASPGSGSNAPALDAQAQQLDQAVEEAGRSLRRCRT